ncbi:MAG: hypothetical protein ACOY0T_35315 [Myxococcota bacterium]
MSPLPLMNNTAIGASGAATRELRRPTFASKRWWSRWRPFLSGSGNLGRRPHRACARFGTRGAVVVELLIAYVPVLFCFLAFWQLGELLVAQMVVGRASSAAGRAAIVVLPDDPMFYSGEAKGTRAGKREAEVRLAAGMILAASPHLSEEFEVNVSDLPEEVGTIETSISANFRCNRLRFVCGADGSVNLRATSTHAYHGAKYEYEPVDLTNLGSSNVNTSTDASCADSGPADGGKGGKGGNDDNRGGGGKGAAGGAGGKGGADDGCPPGQTRNPDGSCSKSRGGGDDSCDEINDSKKRKSCEDGENGTCPDGQKQDDLGRCCTKLKKVELNGGKTAMRCSDDSKLACVNQESAANNNGHDLTGNIYADGYTLALPTIKPTFDEICSTKSACSSTSPTGEIVDNIGVEIVKNLKLKAKAAWCPKENGKRKSETEQIKTEWNEWARTYKAYWENSAEGKQAVAEWLKSRGKDAKNATDVKAAKSAVWNTKKGQLDRQRNQAAAEGRRPAAGEGGNSNYRGPDPNIASFFTALDVWCSALENFNGGTPYQRFKDPNVKAAEQTMEDAFKKMSKEVQKSMNTVLQLQTGAAHTEKKVIDLLEGWADKEGKLLKDMNPVLDLTGDWSPCPTCSVALREFVSTYGGSAKYCWTKGLYQGGIAREYKGYVVPGGTLSGKILKHTGCVTITPTGTSFTGERLCDQKEKNGQKSKSTAD